MAELSNNDQVFKSAKAALENAKRLLAEGEISKADFKRIEKKLTRQSQDHDLKLWLNKNYPRGMS